MKKKVVAEEVVVAEAQEETVEEEVAKEEAMDLMRIEEEIIKVALMIKISQLSEYLIS
jgi:hypothetical protein